jgi:hypothetical protein
MAQRPAQRRHVPVHHPAFAMRGMAMGLEEISRDHRCQQARDGERHQHRGDDGQAEILEELTRYARH